MVDDWFERRTFHADDFDVEALARRKAALDVSVSVVLPADNEAKTIEGMVRACSALAGTLVDELVVMDADSADGTPELAVAAGARVHSDAAVLPEMGPPLGKGDALWRSLSVTSGDIVVFVDSDISNPDPRFVSSLLGPLLAEPEIALVKAFYDRPVEIEGIRHASGGGRVTELMARPLLNLFWPALSGLVQPLSGEYAGRRELLDNLPFFTGYGVELGLLVDTLASRGLDAIAQVDLGERVHHNQPLEALSRMAFGLLQVALQRLQVEERIRLEGELPTVYRQFERTAAAVDIHARDVQVFERPPIASLPR